MELRPLLASNHNLPYYSPTFTCYKQTPSKSKEMPQKVVRVQSILSRRVAAMTAVASIIVSKEAMLSTEGMANGWLDFRMVAPEQTIEEAESGIRGHAESLLQVKGLIEAESWSEVQKVLRKSSANLRHDIYTIIQSKPGIERPPLRKLYSILFNNCTKLDYAARDKDVSRVWQCYSNIVSALDDILSRV